MKKFFIYLSLSLFVCASIINAKNLIQQDNSTLGLKTIIKSAYAEGSENEEKRYFSKMTYTSQVTLTRTLMGVEQTCTCTATQTICQGEGNISCESGTEVTDCGEWS